MTVSRVINDSGYISLETRERVEQALQELGYIPNVLARSLRFKQTNTIALILTDITNPFFTTIARGVEDKASEEGFSVIFCNTDESPDDEAEYVRILMQKQVDGLLLVPTGRSQQSIAALNAHGVPVVVLDRRIPDCGVDTVRCDSQQGAERLTQHLIDLGHRRVALLSGPDKVSTAIDRVTGFQRAWAAAGLDPAAAPIYNSSYTIEGGYAATCQALAAKPRPTGLFAANNFIAIGALRALHEHGLRVPDDISLVTFDDLPVSFSIEPLMTVIEQPAYAMGWQATALLLDRLAGKGPAEPQELLLPIQCIVRKSSGPPPVV
jgi:LacI family transcriptional regulator